MAIWQFRIDLIPRKAIRRIFGELPISLPEELAEEFLWWSDAQPPKGFEAWITVFLPEAQSWSQTMRIWGDERGDTGSVCYSNGDQVESVGFRIDVRQLSLAFVRNICELAVRLDCMLLTGTYHLLAPDDLTVLSSINSSTAQRYLNDPVSTLRELKRQSTDAIPFPRKEDER